MIQQQVNGPFVDFLDTDGTLLVSTEDEDGVLWVRFVNRDRLPRWPDIAWFPSAPGVIYMIEQSRAATKVE